MLPSGLKYMDLKSSCSSYQLVALLVEKCIYLLDKQSCVCSVIGKHGHMQYKGIQLGAGDEQLSICLFNSYSISQDIHESL